MKRSPLAENTCRTIGLALSLWGLAVTLGTIEGVFDRLSPAEVFLLAAFAAAIASAAYGLDGGVGAFVRSRRLWRFASATAALDAVVIAATLFGATPPLILLFCGPLGVAFSVALSGRIWLLWRDGSSATARRSADPCLRAIGNA